ncbi:uncharacterized protein EV420DRAFT_1485509 [Desarmillaria tabescens]|uniref:Uncharacterized protein n=1 Tax=Armillaria tabescens TaxID=1929756 RepID=A0AA39MPZ8_ARMTA|nr:uncharacterized protein EV420DRAFT_1485509 [Desarmillaria tabescens]KAK0441769.1 hypothetical protein EV420DRAFT_1485509 [Desarmillaria tabescens]
MANSIFLLQWAFGCCLPHHSIDFEFSGPNNQVLPTIRGKLSLRKQDKQAFTRGDKGRCQIGRYGGPVSNSINNQTGGGGGSMSFGAWPGVVSRVLVKRGVEEREEDLDAEVSKMDL